MYGENIENFEKFRGKDKYDALNATNKAATNVNNLCKDLKKAHPNAEVEFEAPPNPKDYGKKREGFQSYMQALERWENNCKSEIEKVNNELDAAKKAAEPVKGGAEPPSVPPGDAKAAPPQAPRKTTAPYSGELIVRGPGYVSPNRENGNIGNGKFVYHVVINPGADSSY